MGIRVQESLRRRMIINGNHRRNRLLRLDERLLKYIVGQAKLLGIKELHHTHQ